MNSRNFASPLAFPSIPGIRRIFLLAEQQPCGREAGVDLDAIVVLSDRGKPASERREGYDVVTYRILK